MFNRRPPTLLNRTVLVSLISGNAVGGVLTYEGRDSLILRGVTVHEPGSDPAPADGEVRIDRINVDFIQVL